MTSRKERIEQLRAQLNAQQRAYVDNVLQQGAGTPPAPAAPAPSITPDRAHRHEPFPLTDLQEAYWVGRSSGITLGNVACFVYFEADGDNVDVTRLTKAVHRLIERHDMLRMIVHRDGRQQILRDVPPYEIIVRDLRFAADREAQLARLREELSHQVLPADVWPLFRISVTRIDDRLSRVHVGLDTLMGDAWGLRLVLAELHRLYPNPQLELPPLTLSFRDYVLAEVADRQGPAYTKALAYWQDRVRTLAPAPALPLVRPPEELAHPRFARRVCRFSAAAWTRLRAHAGRRGLTPTQALFAVYAEVIGRFSTSQKFTLNIPLFNRLPLHPEVNQILGEFASFTLLEVDRTENISFGVRASKLQMDLIEALEHSRVHGVRILRELSRVRGRRELMPVVFTSILSLEGLAPPSILEVSYGKVQYEITQTPQVWLDVQVFDDDGALRVQLDAVEDLFAAGVLDAMQGAISQLITLLADDESAWERATFDLVPLLPTTPALASADLAHQALEQQVEPRAQAPVVLSDRRNLSYRQLHDAALHVANMLRARGILPGAQVAIVMEKGWEQAVAVLGILLAGAAYVPIDAQSPADRRDRILGQIRTNQGPGSTQVLTQPQLVSRITWPEGIEPLLVTEEMLRLPAATETNPTHTAPVSGQDLAYVLFTSGSTGTPKGAMIEHRGISQAIAATNARFDIGPNDRVLGLTALHHDMSVYDLLGVPAAGGAMVLPSPDELRDPASWVRLIQQHGVTIWNSVPAFMEMLLEYLASRPGVTLPSLRLVFLGGDFIALDLPERLRRVAPSARLVSVGGPTETTLWNIWYEVDQVDPGWKSIPYGKPLPGVRYLVLNDKLEVCPVGVPGELCCAGTGVARGYLGDPDLTAERFIHWPGNGERIYRTGDMGRVLPDGNLEILGRKDFQVKILGHRVETGEVEAALIRHPPVRAAVVVGHGPVGRQRLAAYVIAKEATNPPTAEDLQGYLQGLLPAQMVPSSFAVVDRFPLSANGKVDRRVLLENQPPPSVVSSESLSSSSSESSSQPTAPTDTTADVAAEIANIAATLLGVASIDPDMDLMVAGVDSITLVRLGNQIEARFGFRPPAADLFRAPSVRSIARLIQSGTTVAAPRPSNGLERQTTLGYRLITEPTERTEFRKKQVGIRRSPTEGALPLFSPPIDEALISRYKERRSHRRFSLRIVSQQSLGALLANLRQLIIQENPKYLYPSGGGLYGIQVYVHAKHGRVENTPAGTYYYHPIRHELIPLSPRAEITLGVHVPFINQPIYDEAAFSLFFIAQLEAIGPMYGDASEHHATLEVGIMSQILDAAAPSVGLGLCHIGHLEFERIRSLFLLDASHMLIHSMVGGTVEDPNHTKQATKAAGTASERMERLREQVARLSPDDVRRLLAAKRGSGDAVGQNKRDAERGNRGEES